MDLRYTAMDLDWLSNTAKSRDRGDIMATVLESESFFFDLTFFLHQDLDRRYNNQLVLPPNTHRFARKDAG